jgi:hypothetical protein
MKKTEQQNYTLFTNISFVQHGELRVNCHALLISEVKNTGCIDGFSLRGFGVEPAWDVFKVWLDEEKHFPYTMEPREKIMSHMMVTGEHGLKPIFHGYKLRFADGLEFFVQTETSSHPIDEKFFVGDICEVWRQLPGKVASYWHAPYMPCLDHHPVEDIRWAANMLATNRQIPDMVSVSKLLEVKQTMDGRVR